jgi:ABC-2 type transport system permease protein
MTAVNESSSVATREPYRPGPLTGVVTTARRELMSYLFSPVGYLIGVLFYLFSGLEVVALIYNIWRAGGSRELFATSYLFQSSTYVLIVMVPPILTMRVFAEERRTGSLEVLLTAPVRDVDIVLGKWLASWVFFLLLLLPNFLLLWVLSWSSYLGFLAPMGPIASGYLGLALFGSMVLALGCFYSSLTDNQLLASLAGILSCLGMLSIGRMSSAVVPETVGSPVLGTLLTQANVAEHLQKWFSRGLIDTGHVVFYLVGTAFFLFLCVQSLESRRWK